MRHPQGARLLVGALCTLALAACAGHRLQPEDVASLPRAAQVGSVPFHGQRDYQCGPASIAMALAATGIEADVDALIPQLFLPGRRGSVQPEMHAVARRYGRIPFPIEEGMPALLAEVGAGHPVIVLQNLSLPILPMWHYAVVTGYDLDRGVVRMHSGEDADRVVRLGLLETTWARSGHWALLVLPPGELPATVAPRPAITAIHDFESVAGPAPALPAWEAVTTRWPGEALGWFARGNTHYALGDLPGASGAFNRAAGADPEFAPAWLNLAQVHAETGDAAGALHALREAAAIEGPWQEEARRRLAALE